jgi:hypothetical protein
MSSMVRRPLDTLAPRLAKFTQKEMEPLVERRLLRLPADPLPALERDEEPSDIFVDSFHWLAEKRRVEWTVLQDACGGLAERWSGGEAARIRARPEFLGELFYLCARVAATAAMPSIANTLRREDLGPVLIASGEELKLRALRSLVGLLHVVSADVRNAYQPLLRAALREPQNRAVVVTAFLAYWPDLKREIETWLRANGAQNVDTLFQQAERNVKLIG